METKGNSKPQCLNVLSIDGGGIRGIIPAMILAEIESRTNRRISELFDVIAGTSTGGILALALAKPKGSGSREPQFKASELVGLYADNGLKIFPKNIFGKLKMIFQPEYSPKGLENLLEQYFSDARLKDSLTRIIVTSYDIENNNAFFFRSANARIPKIEASYDYPMKYVARATSAAPTYFPPAKVPKGVPRGNWTLVDGGVFANNPSMCAYVEALGVNPDAEICVVSLGTGETQPADIAEKAQSWGAIGWARPVISITMAGPGDTVDYQLNKLLHSSKYYRIQTKIDGSCAEMDNTDPANIERLKKFAQASIEENNERITKACKKLLKNKESV